MTYTVSFSTKYGRQISAAMLARIAFRSILSVVLVSTVTVTSSPSASKIVAKDQRQFTNGAPAESVAPPAAASVAAAVAAEELGSPLPLP